MLTRTLVEILESSTDPTELEIAIHDLGQYSKYAENSKNVIQQFGGKRRIMELMAHSNEKVRYQALLAIQ